MSFVEAKNNELKLLSESNDLEFLKAELEKTKKDLPCCAAESLYRTNKLSILENRIRELCPETTKCPFLKIFTK